MSKLSATAVSLHNAFFAFVPSMAATEALSRRLRALRKELPSLEHPSIRWTAEGDWHVTVAFCGDLDEEAASRAADAGAAAASVSRRFTAKLGVLDAFPESAKPRVLFASLALGNEAASALSSALAGALAQRALPTESRPYHPHLTLARIEARARTIVADAIRHAARPSATTHADVLDHPAFEVDRIQWKARGLPGSGAHYRTLAEWALP